MLTAFLGFGNEVILYCLEAEYLQLLLLVLSQAFVTCFRVISLSLYEEKAVILHQLSLR